VKEFIVKIPDEVLEHAKAEAGFQDIDDDYFLQRVLETMSAGAPPYHFEYGGIEVHSGSDLNRVTSIVFYELEGIIHFCEGHKIIARYETDLCKSNWFRDPMNWKVKRYGV